MRTLRYLAFAAAVTTWQAAAQTPRATRTTLYNFKGPINDGANPQGALAAGPNGVLYGTAAGGIYGTVFELNPPVVAAEVWTESILDVFPGYQGDGPNGGVAIGTSGELYGTTVIGGVSYGCVDIFELQPRSAAPVPGGLWKETLLTSFRAFNGCEPDGVVIGPGGALYGATTFGGPAQGCYGTGCGTVFQVAPTGASWTQTTIFAFSGQNGSEPIARLVVGLDGALYGTTLFGGAAGAGTVFELRPPDHPGGSWTHTVLHNFTPASGDGDDPYAGVAISPDGTLYGLTFAGGTAGLGIVYALKPPTTAGAPWTESVLYSFSGPDGANPQAGLVIGRHGELYGTTWGGGTGPCAIPTYPPGCGTVFVLTPPATGGNWTETVLHSFTNADGANPDGALIFGTNGELYGTTLWGGSSTNCSPPYPGESPGCGTVFKLTLR